MELQHQANYRLVRGDTLAFPTRQVCSASPCNINLEEPFRSLLLLGDSEMPNSALLLLKNLLPRALLQDTLSE